MSTIVNGILTVPAFTPTGNPGEYTFDSAIFQSQSDTTGNGAYLVEVGFILYTPSSDPNSFLQIPGVVHRYKLTQVTIIDAATISGTMLWDENGPELDVPTNGIDNIITATTPNRRLGLPVDPAIYPTIAAGAATAAYNVDNGYILDFDEDVLSSDPATPFAGQIWFNTTDGVFRGFDGNNVLLIQVGNGSQTDSNIENAVGLNDDGTYAVPTNSNYLNNTASVMDAVTTLDAEISLSADSIQSNTTAITQEVENRTNAVNTVQTNVTLIEQAVGLNVNGTYTPPSGTSYIGASTSVINAVVKLDAQIKTTNNSIGNKVSKTGDTLTGNLTFNGTSTVTGISVPVNASDAATKQYVDSSLSGLTWLIPVKNVVAGKTTYPNALVVGNRLIDTTDNKIYPVTTAATSGSTAVFGTGIIPATSSAVFASDTELGYVFNGTVWAQFTGAGQTNVGTGLSKAGNIINVNLGKSIGVDGSNNLTVTLADTSLSVSSSGLQVASGGITAGNLASSIAGSGLQGGAGQPLSVDVGVGVLINNGQVQLDESVTDGRYVKLAGSTMSGPLTLSGDPTTGLEAATKEYVDNAVTGLASYFLYAATSPKTSHTVTHNFGNQYCSVTIVDTDNTAVIPESITFTDVNNVTVTFNTAVQCKVVCVGLKA